MDLPILPQITQYFTNGIPPADMKMRPEQRRQLQVLISAYEFYKQNPWQTNMRPVFKRLGRTPDQIPQDLAYFNYIKDHFVEYSKSDLQRMATFGAVSALQDAASLGDPDKKIKAAALIDRIASRIPDAVDQAKDFVSPTDIVYTPYIEDVNPDYHTVEDEEVLKILREEGGIVDTVEQKILDQTQSLLTNP